MRKYFLQINDSAQQYLKGADNTSHPKKVRDFFILAKTNCKEEKTLNKIKVRKTRKQ
jgi:hypothetical protein